MKALGSCALYLSIFFISGCTENSEAVVDQSFKDDWGIVKEIEFVRSGAHSAYFRVVTDKVKFSEIDVTDFPNGKIKVGDSIYRLTVLSTKRADVSYCKGGLCQPHSVCYGWQPCFSAYKSKLEKT